MNSPPGSLGLLFVGHGTRSERGKRDFLTLASRLADALPQMLTEPAFLELQQPDIAAGLARLLSSSARQIVLLPLLPAAGRWLERPRRIRQGWANCSEEGSDDLASGLSWTNRRT
ncbi:MAG: CbiX/SirB N-terminal domain-containing protein [Pirellulales bacterium]